MKLRRRLHRGHVLVPVWNTSNVAKLRLLNAQWFECGMGDASVYFELIVCFWHLQNEPCRHATNRAIAPSVIRVIKDTRQLHEIVAAKT